MKTRRKKRTTQKAKPVKLMDVYAAMSAGAELPAEFDAGPRIHTTEKDRKAAVGIMTGYWGRNLNELELAQVRRSLESWVRGGKK